MIGRIGTLGKPVIVNVDREFSLFVSVGLIRLFQEAVDPEFLRLCLDSPHAGSEYQRIQVGGATHTNKLNLGDLQTIILPLPPLPEQRRILAKVGLLMGLCDEMEATLTRARGKSERLAVSIVQQLTAA